jgi:hypothetical protein
MYPEGIGICPTMRVGHHRVAGQCVKLSMDKSIANAKHGSTHKGLSAKRLLAATGQFRACAETFRVENSSGPRLL